MNRKLSLLFTVVMALFLSACASSPEQVSNDPVETAPAVDPYANNVGGTGLSRAELDALGIFGNPLDHKVLYFAYNSSALDRKSDVIARAHAREIARRGGVAVELHGHADERGSRGYNLALSERRGNSVASTMSSEGAGNSNLKVVAHGEEKPAVEGHNEGAWSKNRRVEISYY